MESSNPNIQKSKSPAEDSDVNYRISANEFVGYTEDGQPVVGDRGDGQLSRLDHMIDEGPNKKIIPFKSANTTFYADDAEPDKVEQYERLWNHQHQWDDDSTGRRTHRDKIHVAKSIGSSLEMSKRQKERVVGIVDHLNGRKFNQYGGIEALVLGSIAYVGEQDADSIQERILCSDDFQAICDKLNVDGWAACKKVKEIYREDQK